MGILVVLAAIAGSSSTMAASAFHHETRQVYVVLLSGLDLHDIATHPLWKELAEGAAAGLMNTRVMGRSTAAAAHLTIGAGARAAAPAGATLAFEEGQQVGNTLAGELFLALTDHRVGPGSVVVLSLAELLRANAPSPTSAAPGRLGTSLREAGISVALVGNSDTADATRRYGALLLMDEGGVVPRGRVGSELLRLDPKWPFVKRTDYGALRRALLRYEDSDLVVVELGDLSRLDAYRERMTENAWVAWREEALTEAAALVRELAAQALVLVLSPVPRADRVAAGHWLAPVLLLSSPGRPALLSSQGTRRPGILLNTEVGAALLAMARGEALGPLRQTPHLQPLSRLADDYRRILAVHDQRSTVLRAYVILCIGVFLLSPLAIWGATHGTLHHPRAWYFALLAVAAFPLALLWLPLLDPGSLGAALIGAALLTCSLGLVAGRLGRYNLHSLLLVLAATSVALSLDVLCNAPLIRWSILGYDVIGGARFYGIGNEYMGVLLTSTIMAVGMLREIWPGRASRLLTTGALVATVLVVGMPWWGANNGGAVAALSGFAITGRFLAGVPVTWRRLLAIAALLLLAGAGAIVLDLSLQPANPSHLGLLARSVARSGVGPLVLTVSRKLAMNWQLLKYTIWTKVLVISLAVTLLLLLRPMPWLRQFLVRWPSIMAAAKGALVTAMIALLVNDSGVVAAATAMIPVTAVLLFLATRAAIDQSATAPDAPVPG